MVRVRGPYLSGLSGLTLVSTPVWLCTPCPYLGQGLLGNVVRCSPVAADSQPVTTFPFSLFQLFREVRIMKILNHPNIGENPVLYINLLYITYRFRDSVLHVFTLTIEVLMWVNSVLL